MKTMTTIWRPICAIAAVPVICVQLATAQKTEKIVITEPGVYQLADLFKKADTVALVKIVSGDAESYDIAVYKATVLKSFKGTASEKQSISVPTSERGSDGNTFCSFAMFRKP